MFKRIVFGGALCAAAMVASASWADGFYVSGSLGALSRPDGTATAAEPTDPFGNTVTVAGVKTPYLVQQHFQYSTGFTADAAGGYRFDLGPSLGAVRTELDVRYGQYSDTHLSQQSLPGQVYGTTLSSHSTGISGAQNTGGDFTANAFYDFPKWAGVSPYVGVGVGYHVGTGGSGSAQRDYTIVSGSNTQTGSNTVAIQGGHTDQGVYLVEVGLSVPLSHNLSLVPAYRYSQLFNGQVPLHAFKVGLRYSF